MENSEKITHSQLGFRSAQKSQSSPEAIDGYLEIVYANFLEEQKLDKQGIKDRIAKLKAEVQQENTKKQEAIANLNENKRNKEEKEKDIERLELEKIDIKNGDEETGNTTPFVIAAFITLLLTLYLFVFYSSSGYSVFFGVKSGISGFINPNVFADAANKGGGIVALILLFPTIFLGLGFLIHVALEEIKAGKNKIFAVCAILVLLTITLLADAFIGYKISEGVHLNNFNSGITDETWKPNMIISDINFYLVLILGFVVYVIWGFLLHYILGHPYLKTESERIKLMIENVDNKIRENRNEVRSIYAKIDKLESEIKTIDYNVAEKQKDIIAYENGVFPINISSLKSAVGEFMGGWQNYTHGNFSKDEAAEFIENSIKNQGNWLNKKIESLNIKS